MSDYVSNNNEWEALVTDTESLHPYYAQDYFDPMGFYPCYDQTYFDPMESFDHGAAASSALPSEPSYLAQNEWALGANGYNTVNDTGNFLAGADMAEMPYIPDIPGDDFYGTGHPVQHTFTQGTALLEPNNGSHVYPAFLDHSSTEFGHPTDSLMAGQPSFLADMADMGAERHADGCKLQSLQSSSNLGLPSMQDITAQTTQSSATSSSTMWLINKKGPVSAPPVANFQCANCRKDFRDHRDLETHGWTMGHTPFECSFPACHENFKHFQDQQAHKRFGHVEGHGIITAADPFSCAQRHSHFTYETALRNHALVAQHQPFKCICGQLFSRLDVLHRHIENYSKDMPKHPCRYCRRHRGRNGFKRKDHLLQHIRAFHQFDTGESPNSRQSNRGIYDAPKTCPHLECFGYRDESFHALEAAEQDKDRPFNGQKDFNEHMRKVHDETPFPCCVSGCDRVGAKGYLLQKALVKHHAAKHPELEAHVPQSQGDAAESSVSFLVAQDGSSQLV
ncbi:hypothetical protein BN1723_013213 [Verticillium longisporum]|uniref:C2H2-type domain-containing protein n=2 Tax=Verticillium longisporum TaxID=100787 RepID=A0A0G4LQI6_VERLO|nr:hypothetical protein BN1723_013213 [Verticillium longisporum]